MTHPSAVGYIRVSTATQADGFGPEIQEHAIREWFGDRHRGFKLFRDEGVSGKLLERPGLAEAIGALGKDDVLVVARLDRLARDLITQELLLREIRGRGARLISCAPGEQAWLTDDPDDPSRKLIRQLLGAVSEYERAMVTLRLRLGRARKRATDGGTGFTGGEAPFGWRSAGGGLLKEEVREQMVLGVMRRMREEGSTYERVATALNMRGEDYRPRRGRAWDKQSVHKRLKVAERRAVGVRRSPPRTEAIATDPHGS